LSFFLSLQSSFPISIPVINPVLAIPPVSPPPSSDEPPPPLLIVEGADKIGRLSADPSDDEDEHIDIISLDYPDADIPEPLDCGSNYDAVR